MFIDEGDMTRSSSIVFKEIEERGLHLLEDVKEEIAVEILNISYSKGGDYTESTLSAFTSIYFDNEMYKKYL